MPTNLINYYTLAKSRIDYEPDKMIISKRFISQKIVKRYFPRSNSYTSKITFT